MHLDFSTSNQIFNFGSIIINSLTTFTGAICIFPSFKISLCFFGNHIPNFVFSLVLKEHLINSILLYKQNMTNFDQNMRIIYLMFF